MSGHSRAPPQKSGLSACGIVVSVQASYRAWAGRYVLEDRWQGNGEGAADGIDGRAGCGAQQRALAVLLNFDLAQFGEVIEDALPFEGLGLVIHASALS
jgi:hypothetical protein